ncbi:MAG TPA: hypothetical protein VLL08_06135, partial [Kineosporiaceae bacterium]|nr:hypothetical protein [Kineosporiaceae bacterium]
GSGLTVLAGGTGGGDGGSSHAKHPMRRLNSVSETESVPSLLAKAEGGTEMASAEGGASY